MRDRADLHTHTTASDGRLTPSEVVKAASDAGLAAVSITDHDTIDGLAEAIEAGERFGVEVVPGIEISTTWQTKAEAHILGYFVDISHSALRDCLGVLQDARWERGKQMVDKLNAAGVPVKFDRVAEIAQGGSIGRPHVARALHEMGVVSSMDSAFGRYLQEGGIGYVRRYKIEPAEAVRMIIAAGGVACCAHVAKLKHDELIIDLMNHGLRAIEVYHPDHPSSASRFYKKFAEARGLIATGGSDAHCHERDRRGGVGCVTVPAEVVEELRGASSEH